MVNKVFETESVLDVPRSGRQETRQSMANIDAISRAIMRSPKRSIRQLSAQHRVKRSTVNIFGKT